MTSLTDDEIRELILKQFPRIFQISPANNEIIRHQETRGRKPLFWHRLAVEYVKQRETEDISIDEACREFQKRLAAEFNYNASKKTVMNAVRSTYGRPYKDVANKKFVFAMLQNDLNQAVHWFKGLSPKERRRWGFE